MTNVRRKQCFFCANDLKNIDYKDTVLLTQFLSEYGEIIPARRKGSCQKHQKKLKQAIERARFMALLPYLVK